MRTYVALSVSGDLRKKEAKTWLTYLQNGRRVKDQIMALIHPMTSSFGGAGPDDDQMPLSTYKGDVPMSE